MTPQNEVLLIAVSEVIGSIVLDGFAITVVPILQVIVDSILDFLFHD
jgi:hypothetical protein